MPDESPPKDDPKDDDVDAELAEFEAELFRAAENIPKSALGSDEETDEKAPPLPTDEEIEARLSRAIDDAENYLGPVRHDPKGLAEQEDETKSPYGDFDLEFNERLEGFHQKVDRIKASREEQEREKERKRKLEQDSSRGLGIGLTIAYVIIGLPLLGAGIGWLADGRSGGTWTGIGTVIGGVLGIVAAISIMSRENK